MDFNEVPRERADSITRVIEKKEKKVARSWWFKKRPVELEHDKPANSSADKKETSEQQVPPQTPNANNQGEGLNFIQDQYNRHGSLDGSERETVYESQYKTSSGDNESQTGRDVFRMRLGSDFGTDYETLTQQSYTDLVDDDAARRLKALKAEKARDSQAFCDMSCGTNNGKCTIF